MKARMVKEDDKWNAKRQFQLSCKITVPVVIDFPADILAVDLSEMLCNLINKPLVKARDIDGCADEVDEKPDKGDYNLMACCMSFTEFKYDWAQEYKSNGVTMVKARLLLSYHLTNIFNEYLELRKGLSLVSRLKNDCCLPISDTDLLRLKGIINGFNADSLISDVLKSEYVRCICGSLGVNSNLASCELYAKVANTVSKDEPVNLSNISY